MHERDPCRKILAFKYSPALTALKTTNITWSRSTCFGTTIPCAVQALKRYSLPLHAISHQRVHQRDIHVHVKIVISAREVWVRQRFDNEHQVPRPVPYRFICHLNIHNKDTTEILNAGQPWCHLNQAAFSNIYRAGHHNLL